MNPPATQPSRKFPHHRRGFQVLSRDFLPPTAAVSADVSPKIGAAVEMVLLLKKMRRSPWIKDGNEVFFKIKRSTQLKKLMNAYCDRQSLEMNAIAFLFDGRRFRAEQTPDGFS